MMIMMVVVMMVLTMLLMMVLTMLLMMVLIGVGGDGRDGGGGVDYNVSFLSACLVL